MKQVHYFHIRVGSVYTAKVKGEYRTVTLLATNLGKYEVEDMRTKEKFKVLKLYYAFQIGGE